ncbi:transcriptional regulator, LysR family [Methylobacterium sp. 4-46]|uniref:LysR family transcriptional regulator n=1 Tax=unclassified Methylobacterium TaxID=2615210 RepID=UPI000165C6E1|nr:MULTISPECIES: LysR family transcriptional regulator [Methylobacterium]ACA16188.1 transcriptional regulator, LysR family [Methylobacterium sp. 4-46]WFT81896.1 LysR family transcriptional regulator [Methylobacterium nodulans]
MSISKLRAFHLVAMAGGFTQAARQASVSQSSLSGQVRDLEAASGVHLFDRKPRGAELSEKGRGLFAITTRLFEAEAEAQRFLRRAPPDGEAGHLRVAGDGPVLPLGILRTLQQQRPRLTFSLVIDNSDRVIEQVQNFRADVGVTASRPDTDQIHATYLMSMRVGLCVARGHRLAGRRVAMRDLAGLALVLRERGSRTRAVLEANLAEHGVVPGPILEISTRDGVREAVAGGLGCGVVADREFGHDSRLAYVPITDARLAIDEYAIAPAERRNQPLVRAFLDGAQRWSRALPEMG